MGGLGFESDRAPCVPHIGNGDIRRRCNDDFKGFNSLAMAEDSERMATAKITTLADPGEETVRNRILNQQNWLFGSTDLYLQPWQPNFDPVPLAVYKEPIWIRLYNLPMEYWGEASLECIGRSLGMFLEVDEDIIENDSYMYARIKIVAIKKVPTAFFLKVGVRRWKQQVEVEIPIPCRERGEAKDHGAGFHPRGSKPTKKWVQIVGEWKVVTSTTCPEKVIPQNSEEPRASKSDCNSGEYPGAGKNVEKEGEFNPLLLKNLIHKKGCSDTKIEYDR
ncbi:hypothetical protein SUGI_1040400 [Cryptomeria japonica]|nr:hypothetical protein SUGI_1040400 [Cryptomeria japonica]